MTHLSLSRDGGKKNKSPRRIEYFRHKDGFGDDTRCMETRGNAVFMIMKDGRRQTAPNYTPQQCRDYVTNGEWIRCDKKGTPVAAKRPPARPSKARARGKVRRWINAYPWYVNHPLTAYPVEFFSSRIIARRNGNDDAVQVPVMLPYPLAARKGRGK